VLPLLAGAAGNHKQTGAIKGRISPKDVSVRIVAKRAGTDHRDPGNIQGEVTLVGGGPFTIDGLAPGKYDLLFFLQGRSQEKYMATRWSEIVVTPGETTSGIRYRLTPRGAPHLIDEVLVAFAGVSDARARATIRAAGCTVKDAPLELGRTTVYAVDIPDDKSVAEMVEHFERKRGVKYAEPNGIATIQPQ
jgi:hypothetical protein